MRIAVYGLGYVGFTTLCCLAKLGHDVLGIDTDDDRVRSIAKGRSPIVEPQVGDLLSEGLRTKRIEVSARARDGLAGTDLALVCVGTPVSPDGRQNRGAVAGVTREIAGSIKRGSRRNKPLTVAYRSTVLPGTTEELIAPAVIDALGQDRRQEIEAVYFPEFLREGSAVDDFLKPQKIVVGTATGEPNGTIDQLLAPFEAPVIYSAYKEAEFSKLVDNAWHGVKVAYANEIGRLCLQLGISAQAIHRMFVADTKLNLGPSYTRPGGAFGGSCLPKDLRALRSFAAELDVCAPRIANTLPSNEEHKRRIYDYAVEGLKPGAAILLAGLAFKAGTDDLRESPNMVLAEWLLNEGFQLAIYEPALEPGQRSGVAQSLGQAAGREIQQIFVNRHQAETRGYDRVIAANATANALALRRGQDVRNLDRLP